MSSRPRPYCELSASNQVKNKDVPPPLLVRGLNQRIVSADQRSVVPTANPTLVTMACESADYRCDEGFVQLDLVRSCRHVPVAGGAASRNPGPATSAQCVAAQIPGAVLIGLYRLGPKMLEALKIIAPETVIRWHRAGFRAYWRCKSRPLGGRPRTSADIRQLVRTASASAPCTELFTARLFEHLAQLIAKSCCNQLDPHQGGLT